MTYRTNIKHIEVLESGVASAPRLPYLPTSVEPGSNLGLPWRRLICLNHQLSCQGRTHNIPQHVRENHLKIPKVSQFTILCLALFGKSFAAMLTILLTKKTCPDQLRQVHIGCLLMS